MTDKNNGKNGGKGETTKATTPEPVPTAQAIVTVPRPEILKMDPAAIQAALDEKMQALIALSDDKTIPDELRGPLQSIIDQARPDKPGMEEVETAWTLTRLSIVQPTTTANAKPESAKQGEIFTTAGRTVEKPFAFIPFFFHHENIMFVQGEKVPQCYSPDAKVGSPFGLCVACPNLPFGLQNGGKGDQKPTECQNNVVVVAASMDMTQVVKIQFGKTSRGAGQALVALARANPYPWRQSYLLDTEKKSGERGLYYVYKTAPTGKDNDEGRIRICKALYELFTASRKKSLYDFYSRAAQAPAVAAAAEGAFQGGRLDAALGAGVEPDLSTPPPAGGARTASKPM